MAPLGDGRPSAPPGAPGRPIRFGGDQVRPFAVREPGRAVGPGRWGHGGQARSIMHKRPTESELTSTYSMGNPVSACTSNIMPQNLRGRASQAARRSSRAGGGTEWLVAHVWSSWSLVSQVKLSWTRSLCTASSWSTPSKGAALAMLGTIGDAARTILLGDEPLSDPLAVVAARSFIITRKARGPSSPRVKVRQYREGHGSDHLYLV